MTSQPTAVDVTHFPTDDRTSNALGLEVLDSSPGHATVRMVVRDDMLNGFGITHGGMVFTLADSSFALACNDGFSGSVNVAQHCEIDFLRPTRLGDVLVARADVVLQGRNSGVYDVRITTDVDGQPKTIALFRGRCRAMRPRD